MVEFRSFLLDCDSDSEATKSNWPKQYFHVETTFTNDVLSIRLLGFFRFLFFIESIQLDSSFVLTLFQQFFLFKVDSSFHSLSLLRRFQLYFSRCDALNVTIIFRLSDVDSFLYWPFPINYSNSNTFFNFDNRKLYSFSFSEHESKASERERIFNELKRRSKTKIDSCWILRMLEKWLQFFGMKKKINRFVFYVRGRKKYGSNFQPDTKWSKGSASFLVHYMNK